MTIEEAIEQLEDLKKDREGFAKTDDPDGVFAQDIEAIDMAVKAIIEAMEVKSGSDVLKILKLEEENKELKRLLKMAVEDFDYIYQEHSCAAISGCRIDYPYSGGAADCCNGKWKHADESMKLIGEDNEND